MIRKYSLQLLMLMVTVSCSRPPADVRRVLKASGDNRRNLEQVIEHYRKTGEREKLEAAYFLIGNMENKFAVECAEIKKYDHLFAVFDSLEKAGKRPSYNSTYIQGVWDSLVSVHGPPSFKDAEIIPDYRVITPEYLIENIDLSFRLRNSSQWGRKISPAVFREFVLGYRFHHEPLERWRSYLYDTYNQKIDSVGADSCLQMALAAAKIFPRTNFYFVLGKYPYDIPYGKMVRLLKGGCQQIVLYKAASMRGFGVPAGIDYSPIGHKWNVLFTEGDKPRPFEDLNTMTINRVDKPAKIFRETFGRQETGIRNAGDDLPEELKDDHRLDVTFEYSKTRGITVPLRYPPPARKRYAVICTFDKNNQVMQYHGRIRRGKAYFEDMSVDFMYQVMYYHGGSLVPASDPFILEEDGRIRFVIADKNRREDMLLLRKFMTNRRGYVDNMIGGVFQGANRPDFSDSVNLYRISALPEKIETGYVTDKGSYRYVRYSSPEGTGGNVAEIEFYGSTDGADTLLLSGKVTGYPEVPETNGTTYHNVFDGNLETFFEGGITGRCWAGLDLGLAKRIRKIRYCPRSDTNFILVGDTYELCYWHNGKWLSMGTQVAGDQYLVYQNVPRGGLYILHNLTRGREERVFTYEEGTQVFWTEKDF